MSELSFWEVSGIGMWFVLAMSLGLKAIEIVRDSWRKFYKWRKSK